MLFRSDYGEDIRNDYLTAEPYHLLNGCEVEPEAGSPMPVSYTHLCRRSVSDRPQAGGHARHASDTCHSKGSFGRGKRVAGAAYSYPASFALGLNLLRLRPCLLYTSNLAIGSP